MLPPSLEDLIPPDHVCFLVEEFMDGVDYSEFDIRYSGAGAPAYHPRVILKLLVMGVLDRVRSSRRLARNARENVVYMYLGEKLAPDFRTISDFRKNNPSIVKDAFRHTVTCARSEGLLDLSALSTDGTRIRAQAADKHTLTKKELKFLLKFVDEELKAWDRQDTLEDNAFDDLRGSDQLPGKSRKKIKSAVKHYISQYQKKGEPFIAEVKKKLEKADKEVEAENLEKVSTTDPESRFMKCEKGRFRLAYNCQATVDKNGFILAADVVKDQNDSHQLKPQLTQTKENLGGFPEGVRWFFDTGYYNRENINHLHEEKIDGYIPHQKKKNPYDKRNFTYHPEQDIYICPQNQKLHFLHKNHDYGILVETYEGQKCHTCPSQKQCTQARTGLRRIKKRPHEQLLQSMREKMDTIQAKQHYKIRKQTVEPAFGNLKQNKNLRTFMTRSLQTAKTEYKLAATAVNLQKIHKQRQTKTQNKKLQTTNHPQKNPNQQTPPYINR